MATINLEQRKQEYLKATSTIAKRLILCGGTGCVANGSLKIKATLEQKIAEAGLHLVTKVELGSCHDAGIHVTASGCHGFCQMGPLLVIHPSMVVYTKVKVEDCDEIIEKSVKNDEVIERLLYKQPGTEQHCKTVEDIPFYNLQHRYTLGKCGAIDPLDINEYIFTNGYFAARKAFTDMSPQEVCEEMILSGLRGRGGGGFPTGKKWEFARIEKSDKKYIICNADEGDPGAFMDRSILEGNPHVVIEGMMIAARAIGADEGYVYVRAEYPLAVKRISAAVEEAREAGILGKHIFNTMSSFDIHIMEGAGAFVCGEETALIGSIEGNRGMPMPKPPFPAQKGLFGQPTVINNVETLATVPLIIFDGASEFRKYGVPTSTGTKTFALTGHVANTGLVEVPMGTTLREIVLHIGGGILNDAGKLTKEPFKAVQIGGPSGGCLTQEHMDLPLDFDSLKTVGAMVGSGGLVAMNSQTCMVSIARFFMQFTQNESCGKCVLCREGTKHMLALLDDIIEGRADENTLELLEKLGAAVSKGSLCALGKTAPNPVLSTLKYFRDEYEAHIKDKRCPAGVCKALLKPEILPDMCKGCTACSRVCPVGAISGEKKMPHKIDPEKCIKCGACKAKCKFNAITGV